MSSVLLETISKQYIALVKDDLLTEVVETFEVDKGEVITCAIVVTDKQDESKVFAISVKVNNSAITYANSTVLKNKSTQYLLSEFTKNGIVDETILEKVSCSLLLNLDEKEN